MTIMFEKGREFVVRTGKGTLLSCEMYSEYFNSNGDHMIVLVHRETGTMFRRNKRLLEKVQKPVRTLPPLSNYRS